MGTRWRRLSGVDITEAAIDITRERLAGEG